MTQDLLDPPVVRIPEFGQGEWLNTSAPLTREALRGRVVLVDFWDFTCVNCIRTLPYLREWHRRYSGAGLVIVGVHAPEFSFARMREQVAAGLKEYRIRYPVLLDNDYSTWTAYANRAWPTKYLIDAEGYLRYKHQGEGRYAETESAIHALLRQRDPDVALPLVMRPLRPEDRGGAACYRTTPELYAGLERGSLGNREGYGGEVPVVYEMPPLPDRVEPYFYAGGIFRAGREYLSFAGHEKGVIKLPYHAAGVNAVLSPSPDPVALSLGLGSDDLPLVEVRQDGEPLSALNAGADIRYDENGMSYVLAERPRMYELVSNPDFGDYELELVFRANGLALYAFTFATCVKDGGGDTYRR